MNTNAQVISPEHLLKHWQGHRTLTRRVIEVFPEKDFFDFSIGGMRPFSQLISELLAIAAPALKGIVNRDEQPYQEGQNASLTTKAQYLQKWDEATEEINQYWSKLSIEDFEKTFNLFGQYEFPIIENILYFIDNEIHHRGQAYVYLRALGQTPPLFWEREL
ncbi:DinB family protein [Flavobacterium sp. NRK F10]|uniref:Damage-inducible protein DinB n=1 Tax=Flavobacterium sediminis TaxID=2201181 RepID=A0A2U8QTG2_9FLAO|nr:MULTISPECIES: DinB family protein [Flavobacterium]AWM13462.1 damage-inducible protein DinB [Flavobacterium sediminis]MCO6174591.1 DinB family protein [Flavobacterium sp. NRK F10]